MFSMMAGVPSSGRQPGVEVAWFRSGFNNDMGWDMRVQQALQHTTLAHSARAGSRDERRYAIGDLAREFGVSLRTLRFYEDRGLISPMREGSSRIYGARDKVRLQMILKGKQLGFTLAEVRDLIGADSSDKADALDLALKPEQILSQIAHLERQRGDIDDAIMELRDTHRKIAGQPLGRTG